MTTKIVTVAPKYTLKFDKKEDELRDRTHQELENIQEKLETLQEQLEIYKEQCKSNDKEIIDLTKSNVKLKRELTLTVKKDKVNMSGQSRWK
jgi:peptidoglycan hydrolase CwlO-like protein